MRGLSLGLLALLTTGVLATSCSGGEFSSSGEPQGGRDGDGGVSSTAGAPTDSAGEPGSGGTTSTGGSSTQAGEGPGVGGAGGQPDLTGRCEPDAPPRCAAKRSVATCNASGEWKISRCDAAADACALPTCSAGECVQSPLAPAEVEGDCKEWRCESGEAIEQVALDDLPETKGVCDVASCTESGAKLTDDDSKCPSNKECSKGACSCRECPNGSPSNVVAGTCLMPKGVTAVSMDVQGENLAQNAIDGSLDKRWNSGKITGELLLTLSEAQPLTSLVVYVTGQSGSTGVANTITMTATITPTDNGAVIVKKGTYDYTAMATGPIRVDFGLVNAKQIRLTFTSPSSWISVNEVLFVMCQ